MRSFPPLRRWFQTFQAEQRMARPGTQAVSFRKALGRAAQSFVQFVQGRGKRAGEHNKLGQRGEALAARYLRKKGFKVLWRSVVLPMGELDIIARDPDGKTIVIVEVKARVPMPGQPRPEAQVDAEKRAKLRSMLSYLTKANNWQGQPRRIDVVGIDFPEDGEPEVRHHEGVVRVLHAE